MSGPFSPIGACCRHLREALRLSQSEVARQAKLVLRAYRKIESGWKRPPEHIVVALAEIFHRALAERFRVSRLSLAVRFCCPVTMRRRQEILGHLMAWHQEYKRLEVVEAAPAWAGFARIRSQLGEGGDRGRRAAALVREAFGLDPDKPVEDLCGLLERQGIKVGEMKVATRKFCGLSLVDPEGAPALVVNTWEKIPVERWVFTAARELGHLVLHPDDYDMEYMDEDREKAREAQDFAAAFLLPPHSFKACWEGMPEVDLVDRVMRVKRLFGVSYRTVLYRLAAMRPGQDVWYLFREQRLAREGQGLLGKNEVLLLGHSAYHASLPEKNTSKEPYPLAPDRFRPRRLADLVQRAIGQGRLSPKRGAWLLGVAPEEMAAWLAAHPAGEAALEERPAGSEGPAAAAGDSDGDGKQGHSAAAYTGPLVAPLKPYPPPPIGIYCRRLRRARGLSQAQVARRLLVSRQAYQQLEKSGVRRPDPGRISAIARALDAQVEDLTDPPAQVRGERWCPDMSADLLRLVLGEVGRWLDHYSYLEHLLGDREEYRLDAIAVDPPSAPDRPRRAAARAREALGLGPGEPVFDLCGLLESAGLKVGGLQVPSPDFHGVKVVGPEGDVAVVVNTWSGLPVELSIFALAHQLGHELLHYRVPPRLGGRRWQADEREASQFALAFLVPSASFRRNWLATAGLPLFERVLKVKHHYRVSYRTVFACLAEVEEDPAHLQRRFAAECRHTQGFSPVWDREGVSLRGVPEQKPDMEPVPLPRATFVQARLSRLVQQAITEKKISRKHGAEALNEVGSYQRKSFDGKHLV